ncbi:MAG: hypothetical protein IKI23_05995 [Lachnospiraceae bacterium]|nr:hypothetical protein [Lachnospiraceae bacterium]
MSVKLTPEERNILVENPDLVMFDPYSALKTHHISLGKAPIPHFLREQDALP